MKKQETPIINIVYPEMANEKLPIGSYVISPTAHDPFINDVYMVTDHDKDGGNVLTIVKPPPPEQISLDEHCLNLIMEMVQTARNNQNDRYREVKKEIKRLMLENKEARDFFQKAFTSVRF